MAAMDIQATLRKLPKMDELLGLSALRDLEETAGHGVVADAARDVIDDARSALLAGGNPDIAPEAIAREACARVQLSLAPSLRRVINATGIIVHTNLGRSALAREAADAAADIARGYSTLEYDLESGERGSRHSHVEELICRLTGAEAALAVNNNAAAVMMVIAAFARGKEAIVSRGQLVEIGGSFRVPDIMAESGATMVEVGTTNKTHLRDYKRAINTNTGLILKVHTSNYRVVGFTKEAGLEELVELGATYDVPVYEDQGSGVLFDLAPYGLVDEPTVADSLRRGATIVTCSGDKLLGGPQAGIIAGSKEAIATLKQHPLARALRLDKMTLAALEATLRICFNQERALREIPTLHALTAPKEEMASRASHLATRIEERLASVDSSVATVSTLDETSRAGGGSLPLVDIPTVVVAIKPHTMSETELADALRLDAEMPIIVRVKDGQVLLDPRTLLDASEDDSIVSTLAMILTSGESNVSTPVD